jgi:hypothetical protein
LVYQPFMIFGSSILLR